jgi:hypothetical protein
MYDSTLVVFLGSILVLPGIGTTSLACEFPIALMGDSRLALFLQGDGIWSYPLRGGGIWVSSGTVTITSSSIQGNSAEYVCAHLQMFPIAPMGNSPFVCCLQGGGVAVLGGTVSIVNSQIYSNTVQNARARVRNSPSPRWEKC